MLLHDWMVGELLYKTETIVTIALLPISMYRNFIHPPYRPSIITCHEKTALTTLYKYHCCTCVILLAAQEEKKTEERDRYGVHENWGDIPSAYGVY